MKIFIYICFFLLSMTSCLSDEIETPCDALAFEGKDFYMNGPADFTFIKKVSLTGDCLEINFEASGCDGKTWELKLVDSEDIAESFPVQRFIRLSLKNKEACDAIIDSTLTFDLQFLRINEPQILFNLEGWEEQILYEY